MCVQGGDRRATLAGRACAPAHGSLSPETQSQLRKGRRGPGPGCPLPLHAARPPAPPALQLARQEHSGPDRAGLGGRAGLQHSLETRPPAPNPGPPTQTSPGPAGTASAKSPSPDASSRTRFPSPLPLPALRTSRRPGPSGPPVRNLEPGTPRAPDPDP